jgi:hypothetical protein
VERAGTLDTPTFRTSVLSGVLLAPRPAPALGQTRRQPVAPAKVERVKVLLPNFALVVAAAAVAAATTAGVAAALDLWARVVPAVVVAAAALRRISKRARPTW